MMLSLTAWAWIAAPGRMRARLSSVAHADDGGVVGRDHAHVGDLVVRRAADPHVLREVDGSGLSARDRDGGAADFGDLHGTRGAHDLGPLRLGEGRTGCANRKSRDARGGEEVDLLAHRGTVISTVSP
jgi:hypothetical protein